MKKKIFVSICLVIVILNGCSNEHSGNSKPAKKTDSQNETFEHNEQEFEINFFYRETLDYIEQVKNGADSPSKLYEKHITDPFTESAFGVRKSEKYLSDYFTTPKDLDQFAEDVNDLMEEKDKVKDLIVEGLRASAEELPSNDTKSVYVFPLDSSNYYLDYEAMGGLVGRSYNDEVILVMVHPSFEENYLPYLIAHEYHHTVFLEKNRVLVSSALRDIVIMEGKADKFADIIYPDVGVPWARPFESKKVEKHIWNIFEENKNNADEYLKYEFTAGNEEQGLKKWSDYRIGKSIMDSFVLNNPEVSIKEWTNMGAESILSESKYNEKFQ